MSEKDTVSTFIVCTLYDVPLAIQAKEVSHFSLLSTLKPTHSLHPLFFPTELQEITEEISQTYTKPVTATLFSPSDAIILLDNITQVITVSHARIHPLPLIYRTCSFVPKAITALVDYENNLYPIVDLTYITTLPQFTLKKELL